MNITDMTNLIGSMGFPICISIYLIHFMQSEQKEMRETIGKLREAILVLTDKIGGDKA